MSRKITVDDPDFVEKIISEVKGQGHFDVFRKECLADVDTQPAFQNLHSRVEDSVQNYLRRQVWIPEINKTKLRQDMKDNIVRSGFLEGGVNRIVEQVVGAKMSIIQLKVEEILYEYVGIEKPIKREKLELEIETDLLPTDLEQVSPDSDKKSTGSLVDHIKDEEIEEEVVEDDFESPAFEPIESMVIDKNEHSQHSHLSSISGLTSQDSAENKSEPSVSGLEDPSVAALEEPSVPGAEYPPESAVDEPKQESQLSQISSIQDMSQGEILKETKEITDNTTIEVDFEVKKDEDIPCEEPERSNFDLKKDPIEFTGNERKTLQLDDSPELTTTGESDKVLQPQDVPSNTMEIDNLYACDTTDSSEMRMEIDLKDETTQETGDSSKIEESSQDSTVSKDKKKYDHKTDSHHRHHHKSDRSRNKSSSHKSSHHHHRSSSSRSHHDDKHKSRGDGKSSSSSHKKSSSDRHRSSSSRKDQDKERKSSKDDSSKSKQKSNDDHHQEKSSIKRRRSTDHDSNDGKSLKDNPKSCTDINSQSAVQTEADNSKQAQPIDSSKSIESPDKHNESVESKPVIVDAMLSENCEISIDSQSSSGFRKERKTSILVKYDYLSKPESKLCTSETIQDGFCGFAAEKLPENPWFECLRKGATESVKNKKVKRRASNNNYLEQKKLNNSLQLSLTKTKSSKAKAKTLESPHDQSSENSSKLISAHLTPESRKQQQSYTDEDLFKPRFDFGSRRRTRFVEENNEDVTKLKAIEVTKIKTVEVIKLQQEEETVSKAEKTESKAEEMATS